MSVGGRELKPRLFQVYLLFAASGLMMLLASPPYAYGALAFVSLVPLLHGVRFLPGYLSAAFTGYLVGAVLFFPGLYWMTNVTIPGYIALALYCSSYVSVFVLFAYFIRKATWLWNPLLLAACWILLEVVRGHLITGFPWLLLSHTQYNFTVFAQIIDVTGAYGLSGIIVALNALVYG